MTKAKNFTLQTPLYKIDRKDEDCPPSELRITMVCADKNDMIMVKVENAKEKFQIPFPKDDTDAFEDTIEEKERYLITSNRRHYVLRAFAIQEARISKLENELFQAKAYLEELKKEKNRS